jgi:glycosyltransferase involved in cell wall biosynthesis
MLKITVVLTCYNERSLLVRAVNSLKNQTQKNFETIIVKDLSDDKETNTICRQLEKEGYTVLWSENNIGVSCTRNIGIEKALGEIIIPFDADDELPSTAIEIVEKAFNSISEADLIFGNYRLINWETELERIVNCSPLTRKDNTLDIKEYLRESLIIGNSPFRKSAWKKINGYSEEFSFSCQDLDFHQRLLNSGAKFYYINETIYIWYRKEQGINSSLRNKLAVDKCNYNNIDLFLKFSDNEKYVLSLLKSFRDMTTYKAYFYHKSREKNKYLISALIQIFPQKFLSYLSRFL